ncbi:hypothetical protein E2C01_000818 [Portunus trituberculatus]|uniref:Uncharacterized protein n=1 Tax=Portunus trituberculatus TaxID=210409 RepID=A0A5B7CHL7_PORTR|nr:hypothetical protein [Portunus trituberculatus]
MDHRVHAWQFEFKLGSPLAATWRTTWLPVRVPFSYFACAILCSASVGTNSGDLSPTWPLPAQQLGGTGGGKDNGGGNKDESG